MPTRPSTNRSSKPASIHHLLEWIAILIMVMAVLSGLTLIDQRLAYMEYQQAIEANQIYRLSLAVNDVVETMNHACAPTSACPTSSSTSSGMMTTSATTSTLAAPPLPNSLPATSATLSPDGGLDRGSLSPDGTKFAGYEDNIKGKIGVAVETLADKRIRHVVLFSPSQSTGKGTPYEDQMSVSWKDNSTIVYNVLTTANGKQTITTETVQIGF